jgi:Pyruvate/2-oxoacid:ferredoxin oxidoreductase gamma subunit
MTEREIVFTGLGGQGVQLMAKVLAQAAAEEGKHAMLFGIYGGAMRGSPSESTLVVGDAPIEAPPIVPHCWSLIAMHGRSLAALAPKLRPSGFLFANQTLVPASPRSDVAAIFVPATHLAEQAGSPIGASMVMLGAFAARTRLIALDSLVTAMRACLPAHRRRLADANCTLLQLGADFAEKHDLGAAPGAT